MTDPFDPLETDQGDIDRFADELLFDMLQESPVLAANLGVDQVAGRRLTPDSMPDPSDAGNERRRALVNRYAERLGRLETTGLPAQQAVTARVLDFVLNETRYESFIGTRGQRFIDDPWPLTHLDGPHHTLSNLLVQYQVVADEADAQAYLSRLAQGGALFDGVLAAMKARADQGIRPPAASLRIATDEVRRYCAGEPGEHELVRRLALAVDEFMAPSAAAGLLDEAARLLRSEVYPAAQRLAAFADTLRGEERLGAWCLPEGEDWYAWRLRSMTTTGLSPDEVHAIGLEEVDRLHDEIFTTAGQMGIDGRSMTDIFAALDTWEVDGGQVRRSREQTFELARQICDQAREDFRPLFDLWPDQGVAVVAIPEELEASQHGTYYPPTLDGRRPGVFLINLAQLRMMKDWELTTLCMHETWPGHHLQIALAQQLDGLPLFRRVMVFAAYLEGWAKYAERLPFETGMITDPRLKLARLRSELYSTTNLALDTGIHARRWSHDRAMKFARDNTGANDDFARVIVDRSSVTPGQMCAYKIGLLSVQRVFDAHRQAAGGVPDRPAFHNAVLRNGALPLGIFEELAAPG